MSEKILLVDDDENVLTVYHRHLHEQFDLKIALGAKAALQMIESGECFAVVISDLRMPEIDGIEFFTQLKHIAPDTVRIMLTGNADLQTAIETVNQGNIFRFLTKPCSSEMLSQTIEAGIQQHSLITAEKELLDKTLKGAIEVLTEILCILDEQSFGRSCFLKDAAREIATALNMPNTWDLEVAAMLCEIGRITIPSGTLAREKSGVSLLEAEQDMLMHIPEIGSQLLEKIPRLESAAKIVLYQKKDYSGSGFPKDGTAGNHIPIGSRIIRIAYDLQQLESDGTSREKAFRILQNRSDRYDPDILACASKCLTSASLGNQPARRFVRSVSVGELEVGDTLTSDIVTVAGMLLIPAGNRISESLLKRIRNFSRLQGIREPIQVEGTANP